MTSQFAFRASPPNQSTISTASNSPPPPSASGALAGAGAGGRSTSPPTTAPAPGPRCCDTGRPIFQDPITGQTVCSCQYDLLNYQRLASAGMPLSMYSAPYSDAAAAAGMAAYFPALGADQAPFYTNPAAGIELKENLAASAASWPYPSVYHPYDTAFAAYPFNGYGMDLNGARRKNATRETTSTLKAWLNEHKKNPYPTKGEKIMLAIITKMTLTQVSTWFANARRRLKKENKMTWEPRNRVEDDDNNNDDDDRKSNDGKDGLDVDGKDSGTGSSEDGDRPAQRLEILGRETRAESEWSESRADSGPESPDPYERYRHLQHRLAPPPRVPTGSTPPATVKPRIWSLADMASKDCDTPAPVAAAAAAASAFYSARHLAAQHSAHPYARPPALCPPDLLESYTRSLGALGRALAPPPGASPSSSSTASSLGEQPERDRPPPRA